MGLFSDNQSHKQIEMHEMIFSAWSDRDEILSQLEQAFGMKSDGTGEQITLTKEDMLIAFTVRTSEDEGEYGQDAKEQLQGVWGHFRQVETEHIEVQRNLLHHLRMCRSVIRVYACYDAPQNPAKEEEIKAQVWQAVLAVQGLVTQGMDVICDSLGRPIFDKQGNTQLEYYMPPCYPLPAVWKENAPEDCDRRDRSMNLLESKHLYTPSHLPLLGVKETDKSRSLREVCGRAAALLVVAVYSECRLGEKMSYDDAKAFVQSMIDAYGAEEFFSPKEQEYLNNPDSTEQEQIQHIWQYENLWVMEWALGLNDDLFWPDHICDVPKAVQIMREYPRLEFLLASAKLRSRKELLDNADLIYLLDWGCVDARISGLPAPCGLDAGVVMERHRSLFWLAGCDSFCDWDEIDLST